ncbi:MAG: hypothetical protein HYX92_03720 [Chloroflexi bacterium]|nr:hypothetical protein [Chloroflexota bacterium]
MTAWKSRISRAKLFLDIHCYISLLALAVVLLHVLPKLHSIKWSMTWVSTLMLSSVVLSGLVGKYVAKTPILRRNWRYFHIPYTLVFYLIVLPHVLKEGFKP